MLCVYSPSFVSIALGSDAFYPQFNKSIAESSFVSRAVVIFQRPPPSPCHPCSAMAHMGDNSVCLWSVLKFGFRPELGSTGLLVEHAVCGEDFIAAQKLAPWCRKWTGLGAGVD